jgi:NADH-quinone oxidoreductase subunit N
MNVLAQGSVLAQDTVPAPGVAYGALSPLLVLLGAACVGVLVEAFVPRASRWATQVAVTLGALLVAGAALGLYATSASRVDVATLSGAVSVDQPTLFLWGTLLLLGAGSVLLVADRSVEPGGAFVADVQAPPCSPGSRPARPRPTPRSSRWCCSPWPA